jgi:hypothetical protein
MKEADRLNASSYYRAYRIRGLYFTQPSRTTHVQKFTGKRFRNWDTETKSLLDGLHEGEVQFRIDSFATLGAMAKPLETAL